VAWPFGRQRLRTPDLTAPVRSSPVVPFLVACLGIAIFCCMDAVMKGLGLALGSYSALLWRNAAGVGLTGVAYAAGRPRLPDRALLRLHVGRGIVVAGMASLWFYAITVIPLAEAIAISFVAPLAAIFLAAAALGERVGARAVAGSLVALTGVGAILAARLGQPHGPDALVGVAAVLGSALLYAVNLVLQRHQAQRAAPREIAFFQTLTVLACLLPFAWWAARWPTPGDWLPIAGAALLSAVSLLLLSWAYARAEAQTLVATEYTGFVWLAILGWLFFGESPGSATVAGAALIVAGCLVALHQPARPPQEAML